MKSKKINYFDWDDIKKEICKEMSIEEKYFRDYHKLIGGTYKDLQHKWLNHFDINVRNDTIKYIDVLEGDRLEVKLEWVKEQDKDWLDPFIRAVYTVWQKYKIEYVKYSW